MIDRSRIETFTYHLIGRLRESDAEARIVVDVVCGCWRAVEHPYLMIVHGLDWVVEEARMVKTNTRRAAFLGLLANSRLEVRSGTGGTRRVYVRLETEEDLMLLESLFDAAESAAGLKESV